jgi:hypothetical protein
MSGMQAISPADLLVDVENPRLTQPNVGQREAMRKLAGELQQKLLALAKDILRYGLSPGELPFVLPLPDNTKSYIMLEGNRRLIALKALENPEMFNGAVDAVVLKELRQLSKTYHESPIQHVQCMVVKKREEADHWIELKHTGENGGAGTVPWGSDDTARFKARGGAIELHSQVLNFLQDRGELTADDRRKIKSTSLKRLVETPEVRSKVGIQLRDGEMVRLGDEKAVAKALLYLIKNLPPVAQIYHKQDRINYANNIPSEIVVKPTGEGGQPEGKGNKSRKARKPPKGRPRARDSLIPYDCTLSITDRRVQEITNELRSIRIEDYPNAIGVLFRVFVELSVDAYRSARSLPTLTNDKLRTKMQQVLQDLLTRKKLSQQQATPVHRALQKNSFLASSLDLLNDYVHSQFVFPAPGDLRAHWNSLQPFFVAIWSP